MNLQTLIWVLKAAIALVLIFLFIKSIIKRSFAPEYGEEYQVVAWGYHLFTIKQYDPTAKWYQKLPYYILFWPFGIAKFMYEWVEEMTYSEFLNKKEKEKDGYAVSIIWQPRYKEDQLDEEGNPKDKNSIVLVTRKEKMMSLRGTEGFTLAAEFETSDGFRGWRLFTLFFEIQDLSKVIYAFRHWQSAASLAFKGEYNSWSKGVDYTTLRKTTMNDLSVKLGRSEEEAFIDEINEKTKNFGYIVSSIKEGAVYLSIESQDLLESQELPKKELDKLNAAKITAETTVVNAEAEAEAIKIIADTETKVIEDRTKIAVSATEKINASIGEKYGKKYGKDGISALTGVYVENTEKDNGDSNDGTNIVNQILATKIAADLQKKKEVDDVKK